MCIRCVLNLKAIWVKDFVVDTHFLRYHFELPGELKEVEGENKKSKKNFYGDTCFVVGSDIYSIDWIEVPFSWVIKQISLYETVQTIKITCFTVEIRKLHIYISKALRGIRLPITLLPIFLYVCRLVSFHNFHPIRRSVLHYSFGFFSTSLSLSFST